MRDGENVDAVETTRARFRPERITTLFVSESAPVSGDFFCHGNNAMLRQMQRAVVTPSAGAAISSNASKPMVGISG